MKRLSPCTVWWWPALAASASLACGPRPPPNTDPAATTDPNAPAQPAPAATQPIAPPATQSNETASSGNRERDIARWALTNLVNAGYRCNEDYPAHCMTADDAWIVQVSVRDEGSVAYVFFDSFATRAPWSGCGPLNSQLQQLQSQALQFNASCNDSSQRLRFNTSLSYREDLDVPAWLEQHRKSRYDASQRIGSLSVVKP